MLKLEKTSSSSGITLRLRERERFFNSQLMKALAIALFLHVGAFTLFQVIPFKFSSTFLFSPVHVHSESTLQGVTSAIVTASIQEEEDFLAPPLQLIPSIEWTLPTIESPLTPLVALDLQAFQPLEEHLWPIWQQPLPLALDEPLIQLTISGDLAERTLVSTDPLLSQRQPLALPPEEAVYVVYRVQMDERTGELFWYERTQASGRAEIDEMTESIVRNLRFEPNRSWEDITGTLHFAVLPSLL